MKDINEIFKWGMIALIVISVVLCALGFIMGFDAHDNLPVDALLTWAYIMVGIAILAVVGAGLWVRCKVDPKGVVKLGIGLAILAVVCVIAYFIAPGKPAMGMAVQPSAATLKLTDAILLLTYLAGVLAILAIIFGEVYTKVGTKK